MRCGRRFAGASLLALALLAAACGGGGGGGGGGTSTPSPAEETGGGAAAADLTIADFAFEPSTLRVREGQTITVTNEDSVAHTFTTDDGAVDQQVGPGQTVEITLSGVSSGGFHCEFHPSMTGTLEVG